MTKVIHRPTGHEIQIFLAVSIPHSSAFASYDHHRLPADRLGVVFLLFRYPIAADSHVRLPPVFPEESFRSFKTSRRPSKAFSSPATAS